ncbi:unnamed protein product [Prorocentrum cordatum]|uniref:BTB domain-containing protein n=1 Tax=Prorocentrum cordatum TaxID=2364126 RepID=A0ABN9WNM4_9DINO|nr:unnamed protein product [Polarella glacialis]
MVHHSLVQSAFVVLDDGSLARPCDVFTELHSGGDSDAEEGPPRPAAETGSGTQQPDGGGHQDAQPPGQRERRPDRRARPGAGAGPWLLPGYLRPFRRLLLGIAGPAAGSAQGAPKVHVGQPPPADAVPLFLQAALNEPELADVEFTLRPWGSPQEPQTVFAHRLILAAACEHFRTMFTSGCAESCGVGGRAKIDMPDWVTRKPLLWLLAYLYQGYDPQAALHAAARLEARLGAGRGLDDAGASRRAGLVRVTNGRLRAPRFLDEAAGEDLCCLLRLCEFYDVRHLKQWAEHRLQQLLTPENLLALSTHAYFCRASQLLDVCVYHMQQVYAEIASTEEWRELEPAIRDLVLADRSARQPKVALAVE